MEYLIGLQLSVTKILNLFNWFVRY